MKTISLLIFLLSFSMLANAQAAKKKNVKRTLYHSHGISFQRFDNLNKRVAANSQFESLKSSTGTFEFGVITERNKLITGLCVNAGSSLSGNRNKKSSAINYWGLASDAGYNLLKSNRLSLYPFAGIGYEKYKVIFNKDISSVPFDSVLQNVYIQQQVQNISFTNSFFIYRLGIGINVTSKKHLQNSVGLQVGYTGSFSAYEWKINKSQTLFNSPDDNLSKIFTSIIIRYQLNPKN